MTISPRDVLFSLPSPLLPVTRLVVMVGAVLAVSAAAISSAYAQPVQPVQPAESTAPEEASSPDGVPDGANDDAGAVEAGGEAAVVAPATSGDTRPALAPTPEPAEKPAVRYSWGGYIKVDAIYNSTGRLAGDGSEFTGAGDAGDLLLVPGLVPVGGEVAEDGGGYNLNARESRFWLKAEADTPRGAFKAYIEADFYGFNSSLGDELFTNSSSMRVRHAYGQIGGLLAGQTWSTFMDVPALPEKIDFGSPAGRVFSRQAVIRYTRPVGPGALDIALESPETTLTAADGSRIVRDDDIVPDVILRYTYNTEALRLVGGAMVRTIRADDVVAGESATKPGVSGMVAAKVGVGKHNVRFVAHAGQGLGRYMALGPFTAGTIDAQGGVELTTIFGGILSGQLWLTDTARFNLALSASQAQNDTARVPMTVNKNVASVHSNVMWNPIEPVRVGLEVIYARRELEDGTDGALVRTQASIRYMF